MCRRFARARRRVDRSIDRSIGAITSNLVPSIASNASIDDARGSIRSFAIDWISRSPMRAMTFDPRSSNHVAFREPARVSLFTS